MILSRGCALSVICLNLSTQTAYLSVSLMYRSSTTDGVDLYSSTDSENSVI